MDDALSWEQRREIRRKKRQELLAESDRLVFLKALNFILTTDLLDPQVRIQPIQN